MSWRRETEGEAEREREKGELWSRASSETVGRSRPIWGVSARSRITVNFPNELHSVFNSFNPIPRPLIDLPIESEAEMRFNCERTCSYFDVGWNRSFHPLSSFRFTAPTIDKSENSSVEGITGAFKKNLIETFPRTLDISLVRRTFFLERDLRRYLASTRAIHFTKSAASIIPKWKLKSNVESEMLTTWKTRHDWLHFSETIVFPNLCLLRFFFSFLDNVYTIPSISSRFGYRVSTFAWISSRFRINQRTFRTESPVLSSSNFPSQITRNFFFFFWLHDHDRVSKSLGGNWNTRFNCSRR